MTRHLHIPAHRPWSRLRSRPLIRSRPLLHGPLLALTAALLMGCPSENKPAAGPGLVYPTAPPPMRPQQAAMVNDRPLCDLKRKDVEVSETAGTGALQPNVRRVFKVLGTGADRRKILICREIDTNLDGIKDVVRTYNDDGQSKEERADTNADGNIDTWNIFAGGRLAEVKLDNNHDGEPDEWKTYHGGKLTRVKRDTNYDKKPDVWEMYRNGRLERMGVDLDGDERVDRWDHDTKWRKQLEEQERKKEEEEERKKKEEADRRAKEAAEAAEEG